MSSTFTIRPAHCYVPGVTVLEDGVQLCAAFRGHGSCGVILFSLQDGHSERIPFADEYRFGSLYGVILEGLDCREWGYLFFADDLEFEDPFARERVQVTDEEGETRTVSGFFPRPETQLPPARPASARRWQDRLIYSLHVRGFTRLAQDLQAEPGTFLALAEKIPYLQSLGVTTVELMPVYELRENKKPGPPRSMEEAVSRYPVDGTGRPLTDVAEQRQGLKVNYWGYQDGYYFAPRAAYSCGHPQQEFARMVEAFHEAGIEVILQLFFDAHTSVSTQQQAARFYVTHYGVDGLHLMGNTAGVTPICADPLLSDTLILADGFDYGYLAGSDPEFPGTGHGSTEHLCEARSDYQHLLRRFVKSDDYTVEDFVNAFTAVSEGHGQIHCAASHEGFTLRDALSYNEKHNEANGEWNNDGTRENYSWNCGEEGESKSETVLALRRKQARNLVALLLLSQGTPLIHAGDERWRTQKGNNNPYCQDNEISWLDWSESEEGAQLLEFVKGMLEIRRRYTVFHNPVPFRRTDYKSFGYPDLSLHGQEAWVPDLGAFSHTVGLLYNENYRNETEGPNLVYLAINMYWEKAALGLPRLPRGYKWQVIVDTEKEQSFLTGGKILSWYDRQVKVSPRSIQILVPVKNDLPDPEDLRPAVQEQKPSVVPGKKEKKGKKSRRQRKQQRAAQLLKKKSGQQ